MDETPVKSEPFDHRPDHVATLLDRYATLVEQSPHNLLSTRGLAELRSRHIPECVAFAHLLPPEPATLLDLGSGGGLPGLVIAIMRPDLQVHLLESTHKKADFLRATAASLELAVRVHAARAEELARSDRIERVDIVTARAVAPLDRLIGWAVPLLVVGGLLYAIKGERWAEELTAATPVFARLGVQVVSTPADDPPRGAHAPRVVVLRRG